MGEFFSLDGSFMRFLTKVSDVVILSFYWLICCLPLVTIGASTTAAYYTIVKVVRRDIGTLTREFFHSFRDNLKDSLIINFVYLVLELILIYNILVTFQSLEASNSLVTLELFFVYLILFLFVLGLAIYTYPALSRFVMKRMALVKFSLYAMFRHFFTTVILLALFLLTIFVMLTFPVGIIFMPGLSLYIYSFFMEKVLWRYMTDEMREAWKAPEEDVKE